MGTAQRAYCMKVGKRRKIVLFYEGKKQLGSLMSPRSH
jgi:hypothetical protein